MKDDRLLQMRVFVAVVEAGGFTAAAHRLGTGQPFVSQSVRRLEDRLGTKLLHRTTREVRPTDEGLRYAEGARVALDAVERAEGETRDGAARIAGTLRVSAPLAFGLDRIAPLLPGFLDSHPALDLSLVLTDDSVDLVADGIDVAIRMGRLPDSGLTLRRLCDLRRVVVAAPAFLARHPVPETPRDLDALPVLAWAGAREHLNAWPFSIDGERWTFQARGRFRSNEGLSLVQMCEAGFGIMRCAEHLARPAIREGRLVPLLEAYTEADDGAVHAVFLPDRMLPARVRAFVDHIAAALRAPDW
ncbi:LysR family transcriptional regulator [Jannaschia sp. KMU-145]|uniref:LysR family transcriptional regulator n=1 Tax=Jannaschia halovivens TaxID=3388667 RepID=UPI00396B19AB